MREVGVAGEVKYSSRTSAIFNVRFRDTEYPEDRFQPDPQQDHVAIEVLDRREKNARVAFHHKTFPRTSLFVAAEGSDYDFVNKESLAKIDELEKVLSAGTLDIAAATAKFKETGGSCRSCHQLYRVEDENNQYMLKPGSVAGVSN